MNRVLVLLMLLFLPTVMAAQQSFSNETTQEKHSLHGSEIKTDQLSQNDAQIWLNIGLGLALPGSPSGIASITYQFDKNLLTLHASSAGDLFGDHFLDIGLLYGRATSTNSFHFSIAAGLSRVVGQRSEGLFGPTEDLSPTIGIPLEIQSNWEPTNFIGLGLTGFANINPEQSFAGIAFSVQIGKLR